MSQVCLLLADFGLLDVGNWTYIRVKLFEMATEVGFEPT